jgi:diguanylate cyclase (GGDEF)-like protein
MTRPATPSSGPAHEPGDRPDAWRVILVGRTGLDQSLRRDPDIELIRARDSLDALGELSDPIDESSPLRAAVVVSPDAEPTGHELDAFLAALRRVDHQARVLRVGEPRDGYDGVLTRDADAARLRAVLGTPRAPRPTASHAHTPAADPAQTRPAKPTSTEVAQPAGPIAPEQSPPHEDPHERAIRGTPAAAPPAPGVPADDAALVRALLSGRSILEPALELARARVGRDDLNFDPDSGRLVCEDRNWSLSNAHLLAAQSAWLSAWARLDAQHRELRQAAFTDPLTGAWNRRYFDRFMDAAIEQARAARRNLTLMVFDIDDFKKYNDTWGHAAGDEILTETVRLLNSVIRPSDRVCRVGGDEFAVIFYEPQGPRQAHSAPPETVYQIATRFQQQVCNHRFPKLGQQAAGTLTISGGLASFPWDGHDAASLLEHADQLSMESKKQGKNALTFGRAADQVCRQ